MKKRWISVFTICFVTVLAYTLSGCNDSPNSATSDKAFEKTIEEKLIAITNPKDAKINLSSNPYDYIKGNQEAYNYIVAQGKKSLDFMLYKFANSTDNGLQEYIMAAACSEILKEKPETKQWASGREWYDDYLKKK